MVQGVGPNDVIQLSEAETEELIQTLTLQAADPRFNVAIGDGGLVGRQNGAAIRTAKILVKSLGELAVTIMDQETHVDPFILGPHAQVSGLLLHPFTCRVRGTWREKDLSTAQMDEG